MTAKYYVDQNGIYLGGWDSGGNDSHPDVPVNAIEVPNGPEDAHQIWLGTSWSAVPSTVLALAEIERLENLKTPRLFSDAILGRVHPQNGKTGILRLQELEDLLDVERAKL